MVVGYGIMLPNTEPPSATASSCRMRLNAGKVARM
jgi:hypothetical protein